MSDGSPTNLDAIRPRTYRASDGTTIRLHCRPAVSAARGSIICLHGIQSHSGWYSRTATALANAGWNVCFVDRRGSGLSGGPRGHAAAAARLMADVVGVIHQELGDCCPANIVLLGLSWGGKLAATVAAARPDLVGAVVLLYPGIHARIGPSVIQKCLLWGAEAAGMKRRRIVIPLDDAALFTNDPAARRFIEEDPLSLRTVTTGFLMADRELTRRAQTSGPRLTMPTLLMLAGRDRIVDNAAMRRFFESVASTSRQLVEFPEAAHTFEFDPCFEESIAVLTRWLDQIKTGP